MQEYGDVIMPQWRGSRETARSPAEPNSAAPRQAAAMEGQSGDCPFVT